MEYGHLYAYGHLYPIGRTLISYGADPEFGKGGVHFAEKVEDQKKKEKQND